MHRNESGEVWGKERFTDTGLRATFNRHLDMKWAIKKRRGCSASGGLPSWELISPITVEIVATAVVLVTRTRDLPVEMVSWKGDKFYFACTRQPSKISNRNVKIYTYGINVQSAHKSV